MPIRGVVFDLDGTLVSQELDFEAIRREIGLPERTPLLEALERLTDAESQRAWRILDAHEEAAAAIATLHGGIREFLTWLQERGVRRAVLSRNSRRAVNAVLTRLQLDFEPVLAREDAPYKPSPHGLWQICEAWQFAPEEILMVGDYLFDMQAGRSAGTRTALVTHGRDLPFAHLADVTFPSFTHVPEIVRTWFETGS